MLQCLKVLNHEYTAVCALLQRSGLHNINNVSARNFHCTANQNQKKTPKNDKDPKKPDQENDDDKDKLSSVLAKAFLWMLTAYMIIAMISLLFPSSNQPEVRVKNIK